MKLNRKLNMNQRANKVILLGLIMFMMTGGLIAQKAWTLRECIEYALENNLQVQKSDLNAKVSKVDLLQSKLDFLPSLNGNSSYTYNWGLAVDNTSLTTSSKDEQAFFSASANLTLFNGLQKVNTLKKAQLDYLSNKYDSDKIRDDIALQVAISYLNVLFNTELVEKNKVQLDVTHIQIFNTEKLVSAGTVPKGDLLEILSQKATEEVTLINSENLLALAYLDLIQLLELDGGTDFEIEQPSLNVGSLNSNNSISGIYDAALEHLPQIKSAELKLSSAMRGISIAKGGRSPILTANGGWNTYYSTQVKDRYFDPVTETVIVGDIIPFSNQFGDHQNWSLRLNLSIPIFNSYQVSSNISRSKILAESANLDLEQEKNNIRKNIEQAYTDAIASYKTYNANIKAVDAAKEAFKYMEQKFNVGLENSLNYNIAKVNLQKAESDLISAKYDYIFKTKILDFYQGNPLTLNEN